MRIKLKLDDFFGLNAEKMIPTYHEKGVVLRKEVCGAFREMAKAAATDKVWLWAFSGFRSIEEQLNFWNDAYMGRSRFDFRNEENSPAVNFGPKKRLNVLMKWVAIPGTSRHHWGTDIDIVGYHPVHNPNAPRRRLQSDFLAGSYVSVYEWLKSHAHEFGFAQPYDVFRGGVEEEPWHWSYAPLSVDFLRRYLTQNFKDVIEKLAFLGKDCLVKRLDWYIDNFVKNINPLLL